MSADTETVKVTLPKDMLRYLQEQAAEKNTSAADILQRAIANDRFLRESQQSGSSLVVEKNGKPVSRLQFR